MAPSSAAPSPSRAIVVIAALPSREEALARALQSVFAQERQPDAIVVVVDLAPPTATHQQALATRRNEAEAYVAKLRGKFAAKLATSGFRVLMNSRTNNMSGTGCWNTGIMEALAMERNEYTSFTCSTFVAILDDDDEWKPNHLQSCLDVVADTASDWVISGLERRRNGEQRHEEMATRETLRVEAFLRGNPGVQGSNLFVRLPLLLRAGNFDENMNSMTDRDLCIRLLDTLASGAAVHGIGFTGLCTVVHHADPIDVRPRVTTDRVAKGLAIQKFVWRYGHRFSATDFKVFCDRSRDLFQIDVELLLEPLRVRPTQPNRTITTMSADSVSVPEHVHKYLNSHGDPFHVSGRFEQPPTYREKMRGLFGIVSSDHCRLRPLLSDLGSLPNHVLPSVIIFANTADPSEQSSLRNFASTDPTGVSVIVVTAKDRPEIISIAKDYASVCGITAPASSR